jgi:hypothetical protein
MNIDPFSSTCLREYFITCTSSWKKPTLARWWI